MTDLKPYQIRGTMQALPALRIERPDEPDFFSQLRDEVLRAPGFFKNAPIILDVQALAGTSPLDLRKFVARVRACELQPIGVTNGDEVWNDAARSVGLSVLASGGQPKATEAPASEPPTVAERPEASPEVNGAAVPTAPSNVLVEHAVRGGQQYCARQGDLICLAAVSNGADVVASGNVHIYAPLRGRAFAGFEGDRGAMIFCDRLEAELVSIAGYHLVSDELPSAAIGKRARVRLADDGLIVDVMT